MTPTGRAVQAPTSPKTVGPKRSPSSERCRHGRENRRHENRQMARAALAAVQRVAGDPEARAGLRALALLFQFLLRCRQATDVAAPANPRRSGWRIFAEQRRMANCEVVSAAATGALPTRRGHQPLAPMTANPVKGWMELNQRFQMRLGMRCRLSPTADVPSYTSGVAMCQKPKLFGATAHFESE